MNNPNINKKKNWWSRVFGGETIDPAILQEEMLGLQKLSEDKEVEIQQLKEELSNLSETYAATSQREASLLQTKEGLEQARHKLESKLLDERKKVERYIAAEKTIEEERLQRIQRDKEVEREIQRLRLALDTSRQNLDAERLKLTQEADARAAFEKELEKSSLALESSRLFIEQELEKSRALELHAKEAEAERERLRQEIDAANKNLHAERTARKTSGTSIKTTEGERDKLKEELTKTQQALTSAKKDLDAERNKLTQETDAKKIITAERDKLAKALDDQRKASQAESSNLSRSLENAQSELQRAEASTQELEARATEESQRSAVLIRSFANVGARVATKFSGQKAALALRSAWSDEIAALREIVVPDTPLSEVIAWLDKDLKGAALCSAVLVHQRESGVEVEIGLIENNDELRWISASLVAILSAALGRPLKVSSLQHNEEQKTALLSLQ